ncbi:MAG: VOC family protein [Candidatus Acidiferrales bacterium]
MTKDGAGSLTRLHHVGFVVERIEESIPQFVRSLGAQCSSEIFIDPIQNVKVVFLTTAAGDAQIELVQANAADSPVSRFLAKSGPGLHHLCYEVEDIEETLAQMRTHGSLLAKPPRPAVAFGGRRIAWVLTKERLLVEVLEAK